MYVAESKTLLEFLVDLLSDKEALAHFQHDPEGALKAAGLEDVCVEDIQDLVPVVLEKCSPEDCAKYEDDCDEDRCHDDEWHEHCDDEHYVGKHYDECDDHHGSNEHEYELHKVITHLTYVTNNFTIDNSINVWNAGDGDVLIVNGDGNVIGDGNVTGDGNTIGDGNSEYHYGDGNIVGDYNGSGNVALDLGLPGELPIGGEVPVDSLPFDTVVPDDLSSLSTLDATSLDLPDLEFPEVELPTSEEPSETEETEDHGSVTEINGHGNVVGDGNVTGDGNTIGDYNTESHFGDGNVVGDGNGSYNTDITVAPEEAPTEQAEFVG